MSDSSMISKLCYLTCRLCLALELALLLFKVLKFLMLKIKKRPNSYRRWSCIFHKLYWGSIIFTELEAILVCQALFSLFFNFSVWPVAGFNIKQGTILFYRPHYLSVIFKLFAPGWIVRSRKRCENQIFVPNVNKFASDLKMINLVRGVEGSRVSFDSWQVDHLIPKKN